MIKNFLNGFQQSPQISYPTILFGCATLISIAMMGIMEANEAPIAVPWCIYSTIYFATLAILAMWVDEN